MSSRALTAFRTRRIVAVTASVALACVAAAAPASASTLESPTIDTYSEWNGSATFAFSTPHQTTRGQVLTIPAGTSQLDRFTMYMENDTTLTATYRAEVYTWDGEKAGREVWESKRRQVKPGGELEYEKLSFKPKGAQVTAGEQYVLFISTSKDAEASDDGLITYVAAMPRNKLPGGYAVYLEDFGDESRWTTSAWYTESSPGWDLSMKVWLH